jgi:acetyl-CoA C-acetyltransferase
LGLTAKLLQTTEKQRALISVCTAGGQGVAALVERAA